MRLRKKEIKKKRKKEKMEDSLLTPDQVEFVDKKSLIKKKKNNESSTLLHSDSNIFKSKMALSTLCTIIIMVVGVAAITVVLILYIVKQRHKVPVTKPSWKNISIIIGVGLLIVLVLWGICYGVTVDNTEIIETYDALDRMEELKMVMDAKFGPKWKYTMFWNLLGVVIIFILLYFATRRKINLSTDDNIVNRINIGIIWIGVSFTCIAIGLILLAVILKAEDTKDEDDDDVVNNYVDPSVANQYKDKKSNKGVIAYSLLAVFIILITLCLGLFFWFQPKLRFPIRKRKKIKN